MSNNQIKIGSLLSYFQIVIGVIIQLVYTPIMIRFLGQSEYGLYNTVASTISMLSILSLGFNSGYIRYYSIYKKKEDDISIEKLNGLYIFIFLVIGLATLICGLFLTSHLELIFDEGLTTDEYKLARILMTILIINLAVSFPMSVFSNIIFAHERFVFFKLVGMIRTIASPLITLPLLLTGFRSVAMVSITVFLSLLCDGLYAGYVIFVMKEKFLFHNFEKNLIRKIFNYVFFIAINIVVDQINWNIDKLLLGRYKGTLEVAVYSLGFTLYRCYQMFSTSISDFFTPRVHNIVNAAQDNMIEQKKSLTELFIKVARIQFIVLGLIAIGVLFFGKYFIVQIWADVGYTNSYYVALLLIFSSSVALIQNIGIEIQRAENKHQFRSIVYFIMSFINFGISIVLCRIYGAIGSAIGTAISLIVANGFIINVYYHKKCNIDILFFWKNILRLMYGLLMPILYGILMNKFVVIDSFVKFSVFALGYIVVYSISMWFIGMNNYEKSLILRTLERMRRIIK